MKASELMIGDLVNLGYRDLTLKIIGLDVRKNSILVEAQDNFKLQIAYDEEEIKPIPLTEEILKANGWRDTSVRFCHDKVDFSIGYSDALGYPLRTNYSEDTFVIIQYVHQLQQMLRLCGHSELANHFKLD